MAEENVYLVQNQVRTVMKVFESRELAREYIEENKLVGESWIINEMELVREE